MMLFLSLLIVVFVFLMLSTVTYQNFQIVGVTFAPEHAETSDVKAILKRYKIEQLAIGAVSIVLFWLTSLDLFRGWRDFAQLLLLFVYFVTAYIPFAFLQKRLLTLKQANGWLYLTEKRVADLSVSREKGKAAPSKKWVWLSWLIAWLPFIIALFMQVPWSITGFLVLVPLVLVVIPLSYPYILKSRTAFISKDSGLSQVYMRRFERLNALGYLQMAYLVTVFFVAIMIMMLLEVSYLWVFGLLSVFLLALVGLIYRMMQQNKALQDELFDKAPWQLSEGTGQYKWGAYYDPNDARLFVPKRAAGMGVTINIAYPLGKVIMSIVGVLVVGLIGMTFVMATADFAVSVQSDSVVIDVPFYGVEVALDQIEKVEMSQAPIKGMRTNGFGGQEKSFGHFNVEGYGPAKLFLYHDQPYHIDIQLNGDVSRPWVIFNQLTQEETEAIYESLVQQLEDK